MGPGDTALRLRALVALPGVLGLVPSIWMMVLKYPSPSSDLSKYQAGTQHIPSSKIHTQNKNEKILKYFLLGCVCGSSSYKIHIMTAVTVQNRKLCFHCGYFKSVFEFILLWLWTLDVSTFWNPFVLCRWGWPGSLTLTFPLFLRAGIRSVKWVPMSDFLKIKKNNNIFMCMGALSGYMSIYHSHADT